MNSYSDEMKKLAAKRSEAIARLMRMKASKIAKEKSHIDTVLGAAAEKIPGPKVSKKLTDLDAPTYLRRKK